MPFDEPEPSGGVRLYPAQLIGHLLMVWACEYIPHSRAKYTVPGKLSDVIVVDLVDLDAMDDNGQPGLLCRKQWWRAAQLIAGLRPRLGAVNPILAHMGQGVATMGNPPYVLNSATSNPQAVARANAWLAAHPDFAPSKPYEPPPDEGSHWDQPEQREQPAWSVPQGGQATETVLERMARKAQEAPRSMPPSRPGQDDPPY
jgi:hypothetical protein